MSTATFDRTAQAMSALQKANRVRTARSALKSEIAAGTILITDVLSDPPAYVLSMPVLELLRAIPRYGRSKSMKALSRVPVSATRPIGGMTLRERECLAGLLGGSRV